MRLVTIRLHIDKVTERLQNTMVTYRLLTVLARTLRDFGHLIRDRRTHARLTQAELAARVGVSRKWLNDIETGKQAADLALVMRTLNELGLDVDVRPRNAAVHETAGGAYIK